MTYLLILLRKIKNLESQHEELVAEQNVRLFKDRKIKNLESQHEELAEQNVRLNKVLKGNADFKVVSPVCPNIGCRRNITLENMFVHMKGCNRFKFKERELKLNTEVSADVSNYTKAFKLEESRDWFKIKFEYVNKKLVLYIIHHSEEETKYVFYYSLTYFGHGVDFQSGTVRCAPMGISPEDAVHNNFTNILNSVIPRDVKFTMFKA